MCVCVCSGQHSFNGNIYNLRLWDYAMTAQQLSAVSCDSVGNVIDWDNGHWDIPSSLAQTDATLSCSESTTKPTLTPSRRSALWLTLAVDAVSFDRLLHMLAGATKVFSHNAKLTLPTPHDQHSFVSVCQDGNLFLVSSHFGCSC